MADAHLSGPAGWGYYWWTCWSMEPPVASCFICWCCSQITGEMPFTGFVFAVSPVFVQAIAWVPSRGTWWSGCSVPSRFSHSSNTYVLPITSTWLPTSFPSCLLCFQRRQPSCFRWYSVFIFSWSKKQESQANRHDHSRPELPRDHALLSLPSVTGVKVPATGQVFGFFHCWESPCNPRNSYKILLPFSLAPMPGYTLFNTITGIFLAGCCYGQYSGTGQPRC